MSGKSDREHLEFEASQVAQAAQTIFFDIVEHFLLGVKYLVGNHFQHS
jgi:hypothetical protein